MKRAVNWTGLAFNLAAVFVLLFQLTDTVNRWEWTGWNVFKAVTFSVLAVGNAVCALYHINVIRRP